MKLGVKKLSSAVRLGLSLGAVIAVGATGTAFAQDSTQDSANAPSQQKAKTLESVVVTGSRIRRVDLETSNPVLTIDRAQIQASGKQTVGDLVQQLPSIAGDATNPNVNNGGGTGASTVSLRGLDAKRTLILVNGHRVLNNDINSIPASMVDRIEVLKDGASATYGSDAIGGVVNFILRSDFQGAQMSANFGSSDHNDGEQRGFAATFGTSSDKGNIVAGIDYNKFDAISSADRDYSKFATYLYSGSIFNAGSSRNPNGRLSLPEGGSVTLANPVPGKTARADYRPYNGATDSYNYAAHNLIQTPQERTNVFALANYNLTDNVSAFFNAFYNKTSAHAALAALPFDANGDGVTISKNSYYNPFGNDFGPGTASANDPQIGDVNPVTGHVFAAGDPTAYNFLSRFTNLGQRVLQFSTTTGQVVAGLKGNFGADTSWQWFGDLNYGHQSTQQVSPGYVFYNGLKQALGPSFLDTDGVVKCGSAGAVVDGCTPLNIFNLNDPTTTAELEKFGAAPFYQRLQTSRRLDIGANGSLFDLPAGTVQLAVGASYDKEYQKYQVDLIAQVQNNDGTCFISQEACSSPLSGSFDDREVYFETFVPVLADMPLIKSLNVTVGSRFSKYRPGGSSWNQKFGVEWRPIDDLLVRGTVAGVFRAPNVNELFDGATGSAPQVNDPCNNLTAADLAAHPIACEFVPPGHKAATSQITGVLSGAAAAGVNLKPEHGQTYDYGIVYDPSFAPGLSVSADLWRVTLDDTITNVGAQTVANSCFANESSPFCALQHRNVSGDYAFIQQPTVNLGKLNTKGIDGSIKYKIPHFDVFGTNYGDLTASLDTTYLIRYNNDTAPGQPGDVIVHMAGHYNNQYGNYTRWRALGQLNWMNGPWNINYTGRYIHRVTVGWADLREGSSADPGIPGTELPVSSRIYHNVAFGYNIAPYHTRLDVGVNNLADKQPPTMFQNNVLNSNTDINTYEAIGRYFWGRVTVTF